MKVKILWSPKKMPSVGVADISLTLLSPKKSDQLTKSAADDQLEPNGNSSLASLYHFTSFTHSLRGSSQILELISRLNLSVKELSLDFLEHIFLSPILETKYFLQIKPNVNVEQVERVSSAELIKEMEKFNMHEFELESPDDMNTDLETRIFSEKVDEKVKKIYSSI
jgi:hypothetical protein